MSDTDMSNPFLDDDDEDPGTDDSKSASAFAKMRKELKASQKELEELRAFKVEQSMMQRATTVQNTAKDLGINPKHAALYPIEQEATPEAIKAWAVEMELLQVEEGEGGTPPLPTETGFTPTVVPGGAAPGVKKFTRKEFEDIMRVNPARGQQLAEAGRVQWNNL